MRVLAILVVLFAACTDEVRWRDPASGLGGLVLSVSGESPDELYFAGGSLDGASLGLRLRGGEWTELVPPTTATLWWVFARGAGKPVWFVGEQGTILRWDGSAFTALPSGTTQTLYGVWGASDDDLWAVGGLPDRSSVLLHFDGSSWSTFDPAPPLAGAFFKVWGTATNDVFLVGQFATILHWDGSSWSAMPIAANAIRSVSSLLTVSGRAADDVFAVGGVGSGVALHWDGALWSPVAGLDAASTPGLTGVSVTASGDVSMVGLQGTKLRGRSGGPWIDDSRQEPYLDLHGTKIFSPEDLYAVGGKLNAPSGTPRDGVVAHYGHSITTR